MAATGPRSVARGSGRASTTVLPRPVALQSVFTSLVAVDLAIRVLAGRIDSLLSWPVAALSMAGIASALARAHPGATRGRRHPRGRPGDRVRARAADPRTHGDNISRSLLISGVGAFAAWAAQAIDGTLEQLRHEREVAETDRDRLAEAFEGIEHQRRVSEAILDTVVVGLLLLDVDGNHQSMNRRHREFMQVAFPEGHLGRVGQLGLVFDEDGDRRLTSEEMPTSRAVAGEEFDDCRIWLGDDPLTSIRGYVDLLRQRGRPPPERPDRPGTDARRPSPRRSRRHRAGERDCRGSGGVVDRRGARRGASRQPGDAAGP